MFCTNCGKQIEDDSKFCPYCGAPVNNNNLNNIEQTPKQQTNIFQVEQTNVKTKNNSVILTGILAGAFALLVVIAIAVSVKMIKSKDVDNDEYVAKNEQTDVDDIESDILETQENINSESIEEMSETGVVEVTLEDYCAELPMINLDQRTYRHECIYDFTYEGYPLQDAEGVFKTKILDMDNDGEDELLAFRINQVTVEERLVSEIHAEVYELKENEVVKSADAVIVSEIFGGIEDYCEMRIAIKDNKYICTDHVGGTDMEGDGMEIDMQLWKYDGNELVFCARLNEMGSEWDETHLYCEDISPQLRAAGFTKTIDQIYKYGTFSFSMAETGIQAVCKLYTTLDNDRWYETNAKVVNTIIHYVDENPETDYYFADSAYNKVDEFKLSKMSKEELRIARNEIFARYSYIFNDNELQEYFERKPWYIWTGRSLDNPDINILNDIERDNTDIIKKYE